MMRPSSVVKKTTQATPQQNKDQPKGKPIKPIQQENQKPLNQNHNEKPSSTQPRQAKQNTSGANRPQSSNRTAANKIEKNAKGDKKSQHSPNKQMQNSHSIDRFNNGPNHSIHMSRIIRNSDISDELALSQDITFDQELLDMHKHRSAKRIQRWWKAIREKRMLEEAEKMIEQTRNYLKQKKDMLLKNHLLGRDSLDVGEKWEWNGLSRKENFSLFSQPDQPTVNNKVLTEITKKEDSFGNQAKAPSKTESIKQQAVEVLDQSNSDNNSDFYKPQYDKKYEKRENEEENKLAGLNELLKKNQFNIKQEDEEEFEIFIKKLNEKRIQQQNSNEKSKQYEGSDSYRKEHDITSSSPDRKNPYQYQERSSPFQTDHSHIIQKEPSFSKRNESLISQKQNPPLINKDLHDEVDSIMSSNKKYNEVEVEREVSKYSELKDERNVQLRKPADYDTSSNNRYTSLYQFLDTVEKDDDILGSSSHQTSVMSNMDQQVSQRAKNITQQLASQLQEYTSSSNMYSEQKDEYRSTKEKLMELEIENEEKAKALELIKQLREKERKDKEREIERTKKESLKSVEDVKQYYEERLEKQLSTMEALIKDKEQSNSKIEDLVKKNKEKDTVFEKQKAELLDKFKRDLKKEKEAWLASEKVRKEKWEQEKINEIRAGTVQKLQPTIENILEKHQEEKRKMEDKFQYDLRILKETFTAEFEKKLELQREKLLKEKEDALEKEREKSQQKIHDQYERMEAQFNEERKRWKEQSSSEYDRIDNLRKREKDQLEEQLKTVKDRTEKEITKEKTKFEEKLEESQRRHQVELKSLKDALKIQQDEWKEELMRKQQEQMHEYQKRLRDEAIKERNKEISAIIEKLGDETHDTQRQFEQQCEKRVKEVEQKWKHDIDEYKLLVNQWKEKFNCESESRKMLDDNLRVLSRRIHEIELELTDKKEKLGNSEKEKKELQDKLGSIYREQHRLRSDIEDENRFKVEEKEKEARKLREQILSTEHKYKQEIEALKQSNKQELDVIEEKIRLALDKKNSTIQTIQEELQLKNLQIEKLKGMLDKQRRELLK